MSTSALPHDGSLQGSSAFIYPGGNCANKVHGQLSREIYFKCFNLIVVTPTQHKVHQSHGTFLDNGSARAAFGAESISHQGYEAIDSVGDA
jgi:hypothetical protein